MFWKIIQNCDLCVCIIVVDVGLLRLVICKYLGQSSSVGRLVRYTVFNILN